MNHRHPVSPPLLLLVLLVAMPAAHLLVPGVQLVAGPWRLAGLAGVAAGIALNLWADGLFKRLGTSVKPTARPAVLATAGPFALSRNPMYLGFGLLLVGVAVLLGSAVPMGLAMVFFPLAVRLFIRFEESALGRAFGADWQAYARRVRRWL